MTQKNKRHLVEWKGYRCVDCGEIIEYEDDYCTCLEEDSD